MVDDSGSTSWRYDTRGRAVEETKIISPTLSFTTQWTYNSADLVASMTFPDGEALTYTYHPQLALDSLMSNRDANNQANNYYILQHTAYDAAGRSVRQWLGAANLAQNSTLVKVNTYNAWNTQGGRLQRTNAGLYNTPASMLDQSYTYDAVGNIVSLVDAQNSGQKQCFTYDALDRLTAARVGDASCNGSLGNGEYADEGYTYDAITGNLSSKTGMGSYSYGDPSHAHAVTATGSGWAYQYDADGNLTRRDPPGSDVYDYIYDPENRLIQAAKNGSTSATFSYDGDGRRVKSVLGSTTTVFIGNDYEASGSAVTKYYLSSDGRLAMRSGAGLIFLFGDHLGSTSATYRVSDATITRQLYKPWGEPRYASASLPTSYTYTGQYHYLDDLATPGTTEGFGLMFYNARWYDPALNQFNQPDSILPDLHNSLDWNPYAYAHYDPLRYTDPTGHMVSSGCESEGCDLENHWQSTYVLEKILAGKQKPWEQLTVAYRNTLEKAGWTTKSYNSEFVTGNTTDISGTFQDPAAYVAIGGGVAGRYAINAGIKAASQAMTASAKAAAKWAIGKCFVNPACLGYLARFYPLSDHPRIARQTDPFHNFPRILDPLIVKYGDVVIKSETYAQFNAKRSIGDFTGVYELGIQLIDLTLQITHHFFRPQ